MTSDAIFGRFSGDFSRNMDPNGTEGFPGAHAKDRQNMSSFSSTVLTFAFCFIGFKLISYSVNVLKNFNLKTALNRCGAGLFFGSPEGRLPNFEFGITNLNILRLRFPRVPFSSAVIYERNEDELDIEGVDQLPNWRGGEDQGIDRPIQEFFVVHTNFYQIIVSFMSTSSWLKKF